MSLGPADHAVQVLPIPSLDPDHPHVGGKAQGLARLHRMGLPVPPAFALVGAQHDSPLGHLIPLARTLGDRLAVRSSAIGEDGASASFAGQYETVLDVPPIGVPDAVRTCLASWATARATAYRSLHDDVPAGTMAIVVQRMVHPTAAGVLFTADPVTGRRDHVVLDAVAGLGEALVSGEVTPDHHRCAPDGTLLLREQAGPHAVLDDATVAALVTTAVATAERLGHPLDLEWAIDDDGQVWWLQARPITALPPDPRALDIEAPAPGQVYTRCNIGEMMPGAATPLTQSTTGRGIEVGMQRMYARIGTFHGNTQAWSFVGSSHGQLLLNLTGIAHHTAGVAGASAAEAAMAICGRAVPELTEGPSPGLLARIRSTLGYIGVLRGAPAAIAALEALVPRVHIHGTTAAELYAALDAHQDALHEAYALHLTSSASSGAYAAALVRILADNGEPTADHHAQVAQVLAGATGVVSADVVASTERVVEALRRHPARHDVLAMGEPDALAWLQGDHPPGHAWRALLAAHGHRGYRELSMWTPEWSADPASLLAAIRAAAAQPHAATTHTAPELPDRLRAWPLRLIVGWAHAAVRHREASKNLLVLASLPFKQGYRRLGTLLAHAGLLEDPAHVCFLTHAELGELIGGDASLTALAAARVATHAVQDAHILPDVAIGLPEPLLVRATEAGDVVGKPVSRGKAQGRARVVRSLAEAAALQPGEILIAPITDVGWTPYFSMLAGLVTDLGSAVSHGAVVAREVGLPAVVNTRIGTASFQTGEWVEVDGDAGIVRRVQPPTSADEPT